MTEPEVIEEFVGISYSLFRLGYLKRQGIKLGHGVTGGGGTGGDDVEGLRQTINQKRPRRYARARPFLCAEFKPVTRLLLRGNGVERQVGALVAVKQLGEEFADGFAAFLLRLANDCSLVQVAKFVFHRGLSLVRVCLHCNILVSKSYFSINYPCK